LEGVRYCKVEPQEGKDGLEASDDQELIAYFLCHWVLPLEDKGRYP